jgi:hypothetical protein
VGITIEEIHRAYEEEDGKRRSLLGAAGRLLDPAGLLGGIRRELGARREDDVVADRVRLADDRVTFAFSVRLPSGQYIELKGHVLPDRDGRQLLSIGEASVSLRAGEPLEEQRAAKSLVEALREPLLREAIALARRAPLSVGSKCRVEFHEKLTVNKNGVTVSFLRDQTYPGIIVAEGNSEWRVDFGQAALTVPKSWVAPVLSP